MFIYLLCIIFWHAQYNIYVRDSYCKLQTNRSSIISLWCQGDITMSFWYNYDVIITSSFGRFFHHHLLHREVNPVSGIFMYELIAAKQLLIAISLNSMGYTFAQLHQSWLNTLLFRDFNEKKYLRKNAYVPHDKGHYLSIFTDQIKWLHFSLMTLWLLLRFHWVGEFQPYFTWRCI